MKKLSKIAQVTFFAAAFAVLFSGTADAYIDPVSTGERPRRRSTRVWESMRTETKK